MIKKASFLITIILFVCQSSYAQSLAFPTAEGFGKYATGGRGGIIYTVTNLNDDGEGSFRKGILKSGPRTIVFNVSGTIELQKSLEINKGDVTILGQTAPGKGITIKGYPVFIKGDNVILRYLRFRMGDTNKVEGDALGARNTNNVIIDHCSISWGTDENASFYNNTNFTLQWCIISEALNNSVHSKGAHGYGGIWGGVNASFHHNLIVSNNSRNPRFSGSSSTKNSENEFVDFRNNVIYNWGTNSIYGGEKGTYNIVNNYFKSGPATKASSAGRIVNPYAPYGKFYIHGNFVNGYNNITKTNWDGGVKCDNPLDTKLNAEINIFNNIETQNANEAYLKVLKEAGVSHQRDAVDVRIINNTKAGTANYKNGIIDSQDNVGGWPLLKVEEGPLDSDKDGMPNVWELENNLNPNVNDSNLNTLDKKYTNIEVYSHSLSNNTAGNKKVINGESYHFIVDSNGTGDFTTVQEAINAVPDFRKKETKIFIKNGVYKEKLVLAASKTNVTFVGEDKSKTILTFNDFAKKLNTFGEEMGTTGSTSFFVFGNDFKAKHITFQNSAGEGSQAVAVRVDGDRVIFENCKFLGNQDTLYLHGAKSRQYFKDCYIEGTVDFIFGWSTAFFENCEIYCKEKGYITAASTNKDTKYGFVFKDCKLSGSALKNTFYLGRPWRDYAKTVWINCYMDKHVKLEGWHNWNKQHAEQTTFYAEYNSLGPGASKNRVKWAKQLTKKESKAFTLENVLAGSDVWIPKF
ncbi:pectin methylesterase [Algibacter amylolyticus]|uniref:Pectin methylesterase n=1 Tax=Algibacter amylolyticus TaxID=1608400 RepID=A0A5M7BMS4_9FLAO|nr:pectinesterase family protein [Algibacter amylolyticus]KAA5827985.1 pectin methylesterase [Algibacter amylolyticus]MBB5267225.1 pectin methylesterase-like acyl-CoA thioesterase [Algibacter amylolyticus]TSJ82230.1 pectin methylesterase [Algibacter amylolyticus]